MIINLKTGGQVTYEDTHIQRYAQAYLHTHTNTHNIHICATVYTHTHTQTDTHRSTYTCLSTYTDINSDISACKHTETYVQARGEYVYVQNLLSESVSNLSVTRNLAFSPRENILQLLS
jgi:hypothetical protein